mgnify:CR=1 FL=1
MEGAEQIRAERVPQAQFVGSAVAEEAPHVDAVGALGGRGEAEQFLRLEVVEDAAVAGCLGVMELVAFLEGDLGLGIEDQELVPENLDSIDNLVGFVTRKRG